VIAEPALMLTRITEFDPDPGRPEITVFELGPDDRYEEGGRVHGTTPFRALKPFAVDIVPARLVEGVLPP
jgi:hypothetical protein